MTEIMNAILQLARDFEVIKAYILALKKSGLDKFNDTWIDSQEVMTSMHISKRTLQSLRDNGTLPYSRINGKFYYKVTDLVNVLDSNYAKSNSTSYGNK